MEPEIPQDSLLAEHHKADPKPEEESEAKSGGARSKSNEEFESTKRNSSTDGLSAGASVKLKTVRSRDLGRDLGSSLSTMQVRKEHSAERQPLKLLITTLSQGQFKAKRQRVLWQREPESSLGGEGYEGHACIAFNFQELFTEESWRTINCIDVFLITR